MGVIRKAGLPRKEKHGDNMAYISFAPLFIAFYSSMCGTFFTQNLLSPERAENDPLKRGFHPTGIHLSLNTKKYNAQ